MAITPGGLEYGATYTLTAPDGTVAVFNDRASAYYVGSLNPDSSGLDSPEIRENMDDLVEMDGAIQGDNYRGRRAVVLNGTMAPISSVTDRNAKVTRLQQAINGLRSDCTLTWTPTGGVQQFLRVRLNARPQIAGGYIKQFQLPLVSADSRIYASQLQSLSVAASGTNPSGRSYPTIWPKRYGLAPNAGQMTATNNGSADTPPVIRLYGPGVNPQVTNTTLGRTLAFNYTLGAGEYLSIDVGARTVTLNGATNRYSALDFTNSLWWLLQPGANLLTLRYYSYSTGAKMEVDFRDAWL